MKANAEKVHAVRYMHFVGDGDSSVYPTLLQEVPVGECISKNWSAQIMHVNATAYAKVGCARIILGTRAKVD